MCSIDWMNWNESFGKCVLIAMCGLRISSSKIAAFSVAHLMPDTIGLSGLPSLCVFGLKYIDGKRV